nr:MAG TPA: ubiquitin thioesterase [Caudoviricetes sp.]DAT24121.1 MAG TPA: ubiquitin thioesterase [Caudoviricetes sp.]
MENTSCVCLLKTSCPQCALIDDNSTRRLRRTGNYFYRTGCAVTHLS